MGYTKESAKELKDFAQEVSEAFSDLADTTDEFIGTLDDPDADDDDLGLALQALDEALENAEGYGVKLSHLLKEGTDK